MSLSFQRYFLKSNSDDHEIFEVNQKVINSSVLLKNIFEFTWISNIPIEVDCSSNSLKIFIKLINIYENSIDKKNYSETAKELLKNFSDTELAKFIHEICILDCDILLDTISDRILDNLQNMTFKEIQEYLQIEDDFTDNERKWQNKYMLEYFISLNIASSPLQFPLKCQGFVSMKSRFPSPLNVLLARICQRSNEKVAFKLALCCRALKNECDRHPIKLTRLSLYNLKWCLVIDSVGIPMGTFYIQTTTNNEKYFSAISKRKVMVTEDDIQISFGGYATDKEVFEFLKNYYSFEWIIPHKNEKKIELSICGSEMFISNFDIRKFPFFNVFFRLWSFENGLNFEFVYETLVAKDVSKFIQIWCKDFTFFPNSTIYLTKEPNDFKFRQCWNNTSSEMKEHYPLFKTFMIKYMEMDGHFQFHADQHPTVPHHIVKNYNRHPFCSYCLISDCLKYLSAE